MILRSRGGAYTIEHRNRFYRSLAEAGIQYFVANIHHGDWETIELLARYVMPAFS